MHKRHRPKRSRYQAYSGPVRKPEKPEAHGGICRVDTCSCGAIRRTNINGANYERGTWEVPNAQTA